MRMRVVVASVVVLVLMVSGAFASFSYDRTETQFWPVPYAPGAVLEVVQTVNRGDLRTPDEGTWEYSYTITNDGTTGMGSPITVWGFIETLNGGPILAQGNGQGWTYVGSPVQPVWVVGTGAPIPIRGSGTFFFTSAGAPDRFYNAFAVDTDIQKVVTGQTTGPTPEPCTLALMGLGLSGAGIVRLLKRRRTCA